MNRWPRHLRTDPHGPRTTAHPESGCWHRALHLSAPVGTAPHLRACGDCDSSSAERFTVLRRLRGATSRRHDRYQRWAHVGDRLVGRLAAAFSRPRRDGAGDRIGHRFTRNPSAVRRRLPHPLATPSVFPTSAPGLASSWPHLRWEWAHPCHIWAAPLPVTSAPGLAAPVPHSLAAPSRRPWTIAGSFTEHTAVGTNSKEERTAYEVV